MAILTSSRNVIRASKPLVLSALIMKPAPQAPLRVPFPFLLKELHYDAVQTFYQTRLKLFLSSRAARIFSTSQSIPTESVYDPSDFIDQLRQSDSYLEPSIIGLLERARQFSTEFEVTAFLDNSDVNLDTDLLCSLIWMYRNDWRLAMLVYKWGEKQGCTGERAWSSIIWVLGSNRKFNIAWCIIRDLHRLPVNVRRAMFLMIERYSAANEPSEAIRTFWIMEKFRLHTDVKDLYVLLKALCKHGNIEEAEEFMLQNKKFFPLEAEGFNIILDGWCNISVDIFEAKRVWREMSECCITPNAASYTHMISCFSKVGNLFDSLRLYDEMQKRGWLPGREVYNSLIYVLSSENCLKEALKILEKMKATGVQPDSASYNSMIRPLCEAGKIEEARYVSAIMIEDDLRPSVEIYHSFLICESYEGTLRVLGQIKGDGLGPNGDTFLLVIEKFVRLGQLEKALKIWLEMKQYGVMPNSTQYSVIIHGLARGGCLIKARELYAEMISMGFSDPKLEKMLKMRANGQIDQRKPRIAQTKNATHLHNRRGKASWLRKYKHMPKKKARP